MNILVTIQGSSYIVNWDHVAKLGKDKGGGANLYPELDADRHVACTTPFDEVVEQLDAYRDQELGTGGLEGVGTDDFLDDLLKDKDVDADEIGGYAGYVEKVEPQEVYEDPTIDEDVWGLVPTNLMGEEDDDLIDDPDDIAARDSYSAAIDLVTPSPIAPEAIPGSPESIAVAKKVIRRKKEKA